MRSAHLKLLNKVANSFPVFCELCITIKARDFSAPPSESTIKSIPFRLSPHQKALIKELEAGHEELIIVKSRQIGISTLIWAYALWKILYQKNQTILYIIDTHKKADEFKNALQAMYFSIPALLRPELDIRASNKIYNHALNNYLEMTTATEKTARSGTYSRIFSDEFAFYEPNIQRNIQSAMVPACPRGRVIISTPKKENDLFHHKVKTSQTIWKTNFDEIAETGWYGEYAKEWFDALSGDMTRTQINRELLTRFEGIVENTVWEIKPEMFIDYIPPANAPIVISADLGWIDDSVVLFSVLKNNTLYIFDELIVNSSTAGVICQSIQQRGHPIRYGFIDCSSKKVDLVAGDSAYNEFKKRLGCKIYTHKSTKHEMLSVGQSMIFHDRLKINASNCPRLVEMLNNYAWTENGNFPHDKLSHLHDALVYLCYGLSRKKPIKVQPIEQRLWNAGVRSI